jgi:hypothetical protein
MDAGGPRPTMMNVNAPARFQTPSAAPRSSEEHRRTRARITGDRTPMACPSMTDALALKSDRLRAERGALMGEISPKTERAQGCPTGAMVNEESGTTMVGAMQPWMELRLGEALGVNPIGFHCFKLGDTCYYLPLGWHGWTVARRVDLSHGPLACPMMVIDHRLKWYTSVTNGPRGGRGQTSVATCRIPTSCRQQWNPRP